MRRKKPLKRLEHDALRAAANLGTLNGAAAPSNDCMDRAQRLCETEGKTCPFTEVTNVPWANPNWRSTGEADDPDLAALDAVADAGLVGAESAGEIARAQEHRNNKKKEAKTFTHTLACITKYLITLRLIEVLTTTAAVISYGGILMNICLLYSATIALAYDVQLRKEIDAMGRVGAAAVTECFSRQDNTILDRVVRQDLLDRQDKALKKANDDKDKGKKGKKGDGKKGK